MLTGKRYYDSYDADCKCWVDEFDISKIYDVSYAAWDTHTNPTHLSVKHRKDVGVPMFGYLCFICKYSGSVNILANYLQNNMGFELTYKECGWHSLTSKSNERIDVWTIEDFEKTRGYKYQAIFIQDDIYDHALADRVSVHALWMNELIPPMEPWVFRLPRE